MKALRSAAWIAVSASAGCSITIGAPETPRIPERPPDCVVSRARPVADTVGSTLIGAFGALLFLQEDYTSSGDDPRYHDLSDERAFGALLLIPSAVFGAAALLGFSRTARCRELLEEHHHVLAEIRAGRRKPTPPVRPPTPPEAQGECRAAVARVHAERDRDRQMELFDALPAMCKEAAIRKSPQ